MKNIVTIIFTSFLLLFSACETSSTNTANVDNATLIQKVTTSDSILFSLLKQEKVDSAFAMHVIDSSDGISDGVIRTHIQMDSVLKAHAVKNIKSYAYTILARDFLVSDTSNVLETIKASKKIISINDSTLEDKPVILIIFWYKERGSTNWEWCTDIRTPIFYTSY